MNALIITLLITNAVVTIAAGIVVGSEVRKLRVATTQSQIMIDNNKRQQNRTVDLIKESRDKILVSNASIRDTIRQVIKSELYDGVIKIPHSLETATFIRKVKK
jgi:hypothetical protein